MSSMDNNSGEGSNPGESGYVNPAFVRSPQDTDNVEQLGYSDTQTQHSYGATNGSAKKSRDDNSSTITNEGGNGKRSIERRKTVGVKETVSEILSWPIMAYHGIIYQHFIYKQ